MKTIEQKARAYDKVRETIALKFGSNVAEEIFSKFEETEDEKIRKALIYDIAKQGEQTDKIVERAKTEKQRVLITKSDGEANIDWDTRSLQDVKLLLEYGLDYINKLDEKNCLSNTKPSMGDLKIISSLKDIIYGYWNSLPDSALEENEVAESCYRWLEKQCEQNLVNKVEPKFHKGDWVVFNNRHDSVYQVEKIENYEYTLRHFLGGSMLLSFSHEDMIRAWTIQDAKDGDVLKEDSCIFIIKRMKLDGTAIVHCCLFDDDDFDLSSTLSFDINSTHPATIEQRDLLFQKMHESGYEWNNEKKELLEIEEELTDFEKSLKHIMIETLECGDTRNLKADAEMLLRLAQEPKEWSEEDEKTLNSILNDLSQDVIPDDEDIQWLKSLKQRYTWKPSEEQMKFLQHYADQNNYDGTVLTSLLNDLKKL